jgi:hypothetical protein
LHGIFISRNRKSDEGIFHACERSMHPEFVPRGHPGSGSGPPPKFCQETEPAVFV